MPGITEDAPTAGGRDELDDLFDYDVNVDDVFRRAEEDANRQVAGEQAARKKPADLGIEEEIQVVKKRAPIAKLDDERLLSPAGIPKLRRITKERLKFKGKGHEYSDVARLLSMYQLWLDDLYPRAKFADGLAIIEKLGHSKRIQTMRKEWINESKPKEPSWEDDIRTSNNNPDTSRQENTENTTQNITEQPASTNDDMQTTNGTAHSRTEASSRDEDMLFLADDESEDNITTAPPEDELDALLAEDEATSSAQTHGSSTGKDKSDRLRQELDDDFAAEEEVMADMPW